MDTSWMLNEFGAEEIQRRTSNGTTCHSLTFWLLDFSTFSSVHWLPITEHWILETGQSNIAFIKSWDFGGISSGILMFNFGLKSVFFLYSQLRI